MCVTRRGKEIRKSCGEYHTLSLCAWAASKSPIARNAAPAEEGRALLRCRDVAVLSRPRAPPGREATPGSARPLRCGAPPPARSTGSARAERVRRCREDQRFQSVGVGFQRGEDSRARCAQSLREVSIGLRCSLRSEHINAIYRLVSLSSCSPDEACRHREPRGAQQHLS